MSDPVYCSFCGLSSEDEKCETMVAGSSYAAICNHCVTICVETIDERKGDLRAQREMEAWSSAEEVHLEAGG